MVRSLRGQCRLDNILQNPSLLTMLKAFVKFMRSTYSFI